MNFEIDKIYKGRTDERVIELIPGGFDCGHPFWIENKEPLLLGLNKSEYSGHQNGFVGMGCVTSSLFIINGEAVTGGKSQSLPSIRTHRIGILAKRMKLGVVEKKIKRRTQ